MPIIEKSGSETFTLVEDVRAWLKEPLQYSNARTNLLAYRQKIMDMLVSGRVHAGLDAGHDALDKYRGKLGSVGVTAYMFKNLRRNAMALSMKGMNVGEGEYHNVNAEFGTPIAQYPLNPPYQIPQRYLPQVDVFHFTPRTDVDLSELTGLAQLKSFVIIQTDREIFIDTPDAENALYDFFFFYPQCKVRGRWTFTNPYETGYEAWRGEYVLFERELRTANIETCYSYHVLFWIDSHIEQPTITLNPVWGEPVFSWNHTYRREHDTWIEPSGAPVVQMTISGRRLPSDDEHLYGVKRAEVYLMGYTIKADSFGVDEAVANWYNSWQITISVNDVLRGTTNPAPSVYTKQAKDGFEVLAIPTAPFVFSHWELNGVNIGNANPYYEYPLRDEELKAVFV